MRRSPRRLAALALAIFCGAPPGLAAAQVMLGDRQDGARVRVAPGEVIAVRLTSNPATGFTWRMLGRTPGVQLVSQRYDPPPPARRSAPLVGRPGVQSFRLKVVAPGGRKVPLRFAYRRWWTKVGMARVWGATALVGGSARGG